MLSSHSGKPSFLGKLLYRSMLICLQSYSLSIFACVILDDEKNAAIASFIIALIVGFYNAEVLKNEFKLEMEKLEQKDNSSDNSSDDTNSK